MKKLAIIFAISVFSFPMLFSNAQEAIFELEFDIENQTLIEEVVLDIDIESCDDGEDNDGDTLVDSSDPDCSNFLEIETIDTEDILEEITDIFCNDGLDNDLDSLVDESDPDCEDFFDDEDPTEDTLELCTDEVDNDGDTLVDSSDPDCSEFVDDENPTEDTLQLCTDGLDNDEDTLVDESDPDCAEFNEDPEEPGSENTLELCTDEVDNDGDTLVDSSDPDCAQFVDDEDPEVTPPTNNNDGGSNSSARRRSSSQVAGASTDGEVLGETIDLEENACVPLTAYMRMGQPNPADQVITLQAFLNTNLGTTLPVTGFFGPMTDAAVRQFQTKYSTTVLDPWVEAGFMSTPDATGYVYKTTLHQINVLRCPSMEFVEPVLING